jgi:hypothetical protein
MSGPDPIALVALIVSLVALIVSLVALIVSLVALILTLLQVTQQYIATAYDYRHCSKRTVGGWSRKSIRRFIWSELRFEVLFNTPIISTVDPPSDSSSTGGYIYAIPTTRLDALMST